MTVMSRQTAGSFITNESLRPLSEFRGREKITPWLAFSIGGVPQEELLGNVESSGRSIHHFGSNVFSRLKRERLSSPREILTTRVRPRMFGFTKNPRTSQFLNDTELSKWSDENRDVLSGHRIRMLPRDTFLYLGSLKDMRQSRGEILFAGMPSLLDKTGGNPNIFTLGATGEGGQYLSAMGSDPVQPWMPELSFVFELY